MEILKNNRETVKEYLNKNQNLIHGKADYYYLKEIPDRPIFKLGNTALWVISNFNDTKISHNWKPAEPRLFYQFAYDFVLDNIILDIQKAYKLYKIEQSKKEIDKDFKV